MHNHIASLWKTSTRTLFRTSSATLCPCPLRSGAAPRSFPSPCSPAWQQLRKSLLVFPQNEQLRHFRTMGDPRLSPDGKQVLLRVSDSTAVGAKSHLWLVPTDCSAARQLTGSPDSDKGGERSGAWMPDGQSLLFLAHRGEHTSLFRLPMNGGEAKAFELKAAPLADESKLPGALPPAAPDAAKPAKEDKPEELDLDVASFRISPNGKTIAILADDPQTPGEKKQKDAKADASWVDHDIHGSRLYLLDIASGKLTAAGVPFDVRGAEWSSDSSKLIVVREEPNGASELGTAMSGWIVAMSDPAHPTKVDDLPATLEAAAWSFDGASLVYLAQAKQDAPPGYVDLYRYTLTTKSTTNLTDGFPGTIGRMEPLPLKDGSILEIAEKGLSTLALNYAATDGRTLAIESPSATVSGLVTNSAQTGFVYVGSSGGSAPRLFYAVSLSESPKVLATPSLPPEGMKSIAPKRPPGRARVSLLKECSTSRPRPRWVKSRSSWKCMVVRLVLISIVIRLTLTTLWVKAGRCSKQTHAAAPGAAQRLPPPTRTTWAAATTATSWPVSTTSLKPLPSIRQSWPLPVIATAVRWLPLSKPGQTASKPS